MILKYLFHNVPFRVNWSKLPLELQKKKFSEFKVIKNQKKILYKKFIS